MKNSTAKINVPVSKKMRAHLEDIAKKEECSLNFLIHSTLVDFLAETSSNSSMNEACDTKPVRRRKII